MTKYDDVVRFCLVCRIKFQYQCFQNSKIAYIFSIVFSEKNDVSYGHLLRINIEVIAATHFYSSFFGGRYKYYMKAFTFAVNPLLKSDINTYLIPHFKTNKSCHMPVS